MKLKQSLCIRGLLESDYNWITNILNESWGSTRVVSRGVIHQADKLPGLIAEIEGHRVGALVWNVSMKMLEIVTLNVLRTREGIGRALVDEVIKKAISLDCFRVWVITTNDNTEAVKFYESIGFATVAVHKDAVAESRKLKPEIPLIGIDGVPITDEIELEIQL